ncbi:MULTISPECIES: hypothetical protein [Cyanophyceae]|uniref:hypothetical protein n=1 Tax=Cyanophyceae TaxID=3028117 RepID=UPI001689EDF1|nr:hypothetical protein [Trichocoleus sp. FACHB-69]MBD1934160.1 hypothetical protein [Trichocoleus sp. FACHB-69]
MLETQIHEGDWCANCAAIGFNSREDYKTKCSHNCLKFQPVHQDLSNESLISIPSFDAAKSTDSKLRQAVLMILYEYHARHPDRYHCFDITSDFIAKSLNIRVADVVRVVSPMEEEGEVITERYLADSYFRYIRITSRGIQMIDEEPLFGRFDTAEVRRVGHLINMPNSNFGAIALNVGDNNQNYANITSMSESDTFNNNFSQPNIANFANKNEDNARQQAKVNQYSYASEQKQTLAEAAGEIQRLLKQLEETNPTATEAEQKAFVTASIPRTKRERVVSAVQAAGKEALKELLDNSYLNVAIAAIEDWKETA